ncbi:MAG: glycosyltransferase family 2 protein [Bacteroidota bacterium]
MTKNLDISVIVPLYNEEESLPELCTWISRVMNQNKYSYEVILVDDGSRDNSWEVTSQISEQNPSFKAIKFSRNYGKSAALYTGFQAAEGKVVITMDADLQDSPDEIPELYKMIIEGNLDVVSGWKKKRHDPISKTIPTKLYNAVTRWVSGVYLHDFNCGLKAYKLEVVKTIRLYGDMHRYIPVIAKWNGFEKIGEKVVMHQARKYGTTKFGLLRFLGFLDLLSITFVHKFGKRPIYFFGSLGVFSFFIGSLIIGWLIAEKIYKIWANISYRNLTDNPLFFISLTVVIIGVQLFLAGFVGELLTTNSERTTDYQIKEKIGF